MSLNFPCAQHTTYRRPISSWLLTWCNNGEQEMLHIPNFDRKSLNELREILENMELSFGMNGADIKLALNKVGRLNFVNNLTIRNHGNRITISLMQGVNFKV